MDAREGRCWDANVCESDPGRLIFLWRIPSSCLKTALAWRSWFTSKRIFSLKDGGTFHKPSCRIQRTPSQVMSEAGFSWDFLHLIRKPCLSMVVKIFRRLIWRIILFVSQVIQSSKYASTGMPSWWSLEESDGQKQEYTLREALIRNVCSTQQLSSDVILMVAAEELTAVCYSPSFYIYGLYPGYHSKMFRKNLSKKSLKKKLSKSPNLSKLRKPFEIEISSKTKRRIFFDSIRDSLRSSLSSFFSLLLQQYGDRSHRLDSQE